MTSAIRGPWRFRLNRTADETGVSGVGHVADGVQFQDRTCVLRWRTDAASTAVYAALDELVKIHGHNGKTVVEWIGQPPTVEFSHGATDCYQDFCENCPFACIGGLGARDNPKLKYAKPGHEAEYLRGYEAAAQDLYGTDWRTCEFGWKPAMVIP